MGSLIDPVIDKERTLQMNDFIPRRIGDRILWLKNLAAKLPDAAKELSLPDAMQKELLKTCSTLVSAYEANEQKLTQYQQQVARTEELEAQLYPELRAQVRLIKAQPAYLDSLGKGLGIVTPDGATAAGGSEPKPALTVEPEPGFVRVKFKKGGGDSVHVYGRRAGEPAWQFLARDTNSPYDDHTPLAKPGVPEVREYRVRAVRHDAEYGPFSDVAVVTQHT